MSLTHTKALALVLLGAALFVFAWWCLADRRSPIHQYWRRYIADLDVRLRALFMTTKGRTVATAQLLATVAIAVVGVGASLSGWPTVCLAIAVLPRAYLHRAARLRVQKIEAKLDGFVLTLANALKTTPNVTAALRVTHHVLSPPLSDELGLVLKEIKLGATVDQALLNMSVRVRSPQLDSALATILIGRNTGGNLSEILETNAATFREIARLHGVVETKTSEAKYQSYVLLALPIVAVVGIETTMPGFFTPLQRSVQGLAVFGTAILLWIASFIAMRSITRVDV